MIFDSLLGTNVPDPDLIRRCDIIFPEGEVTIFGFVIIGEGILGAAFCCELGNCGAE